ncbi:MULTISPECIES: ribokinase [unclassified Thermosipho (in: thermotogales)]|uniref:ribokinase n=1 Tax=unclassified Thermosipho (in: thermotogales) TaxID=2676525 RepID=UPI000984C4D7|nr:MULTISPECIES: ribokinase [unclassified Thermosipho (in: thermotogales)]MBT1247018.1 ribokinase [Thermosipho sp. 1244]OOC47041.1 ribokinase [Thermosipho sp. 1223]
MIAVVGSSNMDIVLSTERFTRPGETQKAKKLEFFPGGKGSNQAVTIAKLSDEEVYFLTCIGNDSYGELLKKRYDELNISGYTVVDENNGLAFIEVTQEGENRIIIYQGANKYLTKDIVDDHIQNLIKADIVLLQNEIPFDTTLYVASLLKKEGKIIIFDPAPVEGVTKEILKYVDYLTPNEEEIKLLSINFFGDFISPEDSYQKLKKLGLKKLVVKLGDKGVKYFDETQIIEQQSFKVKAIDTTAAGDVFNGAFAVALCEGKDIKDALKFASLAAAVSVTKKGAQSSIPTRQEVEEFF